LGITGLLPFEQSWRLPLLHAEQIRERIDAGDIEGDKDDKDPNIPPPMRILDIEVVTEKFVRRAIGAKLALRGGSGVRDVSSFGGDVPSKILGTRLTRRWIDMTVLDIRTADLLSTESIADHAFDQVRVRRQPIHPPPPTQLIERLQDAIEEQHKIEQRGEDQPCNFSARSYSCHCLSNGRIVDG